MKIEDKKLHKIVNESLKNVINEIGGNQQQPQQQNNQQQMQQQNNQLTPYQQQLSRFLMQMNEQIKQIANNQKIILQALQDLQYRLIKR